MRIAMEVGTHSPWVSRLLAELGHEVLVADPRKLRFIYQNRKKGDRVDARSLARVGRLDPELLSPVTHRPEGMAQDLAVVRARDVLVRARVKLINHARGAVKATGSRLRKCSTPTFVEKTGEQLPENLKETLAPVMTAIEVVSASRSCVLDRRIQGAGEEEVPRDTALLQAGSRSGPDRGAGLRADAASDPGRFAQEPGSGAVPRAGTGATAERRRRIRS